MDKSQLTWWNLLPYKIDGTLITLGGTDLFSFGSSSDGSGFPIRYYGLMYLASFYTCYYLMKRISKRDKLGVTDEFMDGLLSWVVAGILIGGRLGYVLFYNLPYYLQNPLEVVWPFKGGSFAGISGMSYHGGMLGALLFGLYFAQKNKVNPWLVANLGFVTAPIGYAWGRLGNFLNGELYGRPTDSGIGMLFPTDKTQTLRHPSQLYELAVEGPILFAFLWTMWKFPKWREHIVGFYLIGYGLGRFIVEYFRQPDAHLGLQAGFSRGQYLCIAMMIGGTLLIVIRQKYLNKKNA